MDIPIKNDPDEMSVGNIFQRGINCPAILHAPGVMKKIAVSERVSFRVLKSKPLRSDTFGVPEALFLPAHLNIAGQRLRLELETVLENKVMQGPLRPGASATYIGQKC